MKQKDSLTNDIKCLREELQQVRSDRDRLTSQMLAVTAEVEKLREFNGETLVEVESLTAKTNTFEVKSVPMFTH